MWLILKKKIIAHNEPFLELIFWCKIIFKTCKKWCGHEGFIYLVSCLKRDHVKSEFQKHCDSQP